MGHTRLGWVPKTQAWAAVAARVTEDLGERKTTAQAALLSEDISQVARQALEAAESGLKRAVQDEGLRYTFFLLTQLALASRQDDWEQRLDELGLDFSSDAGPLGLVSAVQQTVDDRLALSGPSTDVREIALQAAGEALLELVEPEALTLFGSGASEVRSAVRRLSTKAGFSRLGHHFFASFMTRFLNFYLSRLTASAVGTSRLPQLGDRGSFDEALRNHCYQSARIVRDFCGGWYSKTSYVEGIDEENTSRFLAVALQKLRAELKRQRSDS